MSRTRLVSFLYIFLLSAVPSGALALSVGDFLVSDLSRQAIFQIDPATGDRTVISGCSVALVASSCPSGQLIGGGATMVRPSGLARAPSLDPNTPFYVTDPFTGSLLRIDPVSGFRTDISSSATGSGPSFDIPAGVAIQPNGNLLVADEGLRALIDVNVNTGQRTIISSSTVGAGDFFSDPYDLFVDFNGDALLLDTALDAIFRVDLASGDRTIVSSLALGSGPAFVDPRNITRDAAGNILVSDSNTDPDAPGMIYSVDPVTGVRTFVTSQTDGGRSIRVAADLVVDGDGGIVLLDFGPGIVLSIDTLTGDRTVLSSSQLGNGLSLSAPSWIVSVSGPLVIPEPNTLFLLAIGFAMLSRYDPVGRRKR